ncbi:MULTISPECIES: DUF3305 domain-containing protein [Vibrio]|uniref:DUF3305 domain-containing protein n=1 Tax=Vibrio algicola TaxID=2662262 RepID=A0A5Q0TGA4_9VIBR|nr:MULTISPECIES: DUF3305 domain-containing protein [Vibrio]MBD1575574.1 DUF3305 domain-containing protein [Vibrio sp. S11_S32]
MIEKSPKCWPLNCLLEKHIKQIGRWETESWQWEGVDLSPQASQPHTYFQLLELFKDERSDYRFNLSSNNPKLFLALEFLDTNSAPKISHLTASQATIACYMDTDYLVLSIDMPLPIQAWMEAFIGRHGELIEVRKKKRQGAGRSNGN